MPRPPRKRARKTAKRSAPRVPDARLPFITDDRCWHVSDTGGSDLFDFARGSEIGELGAMLFIKSLCRSATEPHTHVRDVVFDMLGPLLGPHSMQRKGEISGFFNVIDRMLVEAAREHSDRYARLEDEALLDRFHTVCKRSSKEYRLEMDLAAMGGDEAEAAHLMREITDSPPRHRETLLKVIQRIAAEAGRDHKPFSDALRDFPSQVRAGEDPCTYLERLLQEIPTGEA